MKQKKRQSEVSQSGPKKVLTNYENMLRFAIVMQMQKMIGAKNRNLNLCIVSDYRKAGIE